MFRVRFIAPGTRALPILRGSTGQAWFTRSGEGTFQVSRGNRRGRIRVDPENRWHFVWEGTGEHYFFNGTTCVLADGMVADGAVDP